MNEITLNYPIPPIRARMDASFPMIVIMQHQDAEQFINNYYLQLYFAKDLGNRSMGFNYALYKNTRFHNEYLLDCVEFIYYDLPENYVEIMVRDVNDHYYVYCYLDEYYMPDTGFYQKEHFCHDNLIYGFNNDRQKFYSIGVGPDGIIRDTNIDYEVIAGVVKKEENRFKFFRPDIAKSYRFNLDTLKWQIRDYLRAENTCASFNDLSLFEDQTVLGVDTYNHLMDYFRAYMRGELEFDIRNAYLLFEHKKLSCGRMRYLSCIADIDPNLLPLCERNEQDADIVKNLLLKSSFQKSDRILDKFIRLTETIRACEISVLEEILKI